MNRLLISFMLMVILIACQEPNLPVGPLSLQSRNSTGTSAAVRLTAHRWVQVEERWLGFPQQVIRHPFSKWSTCATDDEFVFTPSGEFYWYSGPTECTDTTPATPLVVQNQYDLYPQRSHGFTILAEGDTLVVEAMGVRAKLAFAGDTLQLTSRLTGTGTQEFAYVIRTQSFLPVSP